MRYTHTHQDLLIYMNMGKTHMGKRFPKEETTKFQIQGEFNYLGLFFRNLDLNSWKCF